MNGPEAFANFRCSGFPALTPTSFRAKTLKTEPFTRRLTCPDAGLNVNHGNIRKFITREGADIMDTRVWRDVKHKRKPT